MDGSGEERLPQRHVTELSSFFAVHARWLFGHAVLRTRGDRELAADLVQDTFEAAARAWTRLRRRAGSQQRAWLLGTLANKDVSDFRRKEAFRRRQPDIQARYQGTAADTAAQALNAIALDQARQIIEDMPPRQRKPHPPSASTTGPGSSTEPHRGTRPPADRKLRPARP
jgi:DNA-directed RNA polymerase specialized sigma24 family protein